MTSTSVAARLRLQDKVAVVFGAGGEVGASVAEELAAQGARLFVSGRSPENVKPIAEAVAARDRLGRLTELDSLDEAAVDRYLHEVVAAAGGVDVVFNAMGPQAVDYGNATDTMALPVDKFMLPISTIDASQFITARATARYMRRQGSGVVVFLSATPSWGGDRGGGEGQGLFDPAVPAAGASGRGHAVRERLDTAAGPGRAAAPGKGRPAAPRHRPGHPVGDHRCASPSPTRGGAQARSRGRRPGGGAPHDGLRPHRSEPGVERRKQPLVGGSARQRDHPLDRSLARGALGSPAALSSSPIWSMCTKGSRSTPANARRTGKPSPASAGSAFHRGSR
jgi:NAD(P)-dependent dehydrogenase (short-subunit alcohol dehydrogenase family)